MLDTYIQALTFGYGATFLVALFVLLLEKAIVKAYIAFKKWRDPWHSLR